MVTALTAGLRASTRAIAASSSSSGFTSRRATSAASPSPSWRSYSANPPINHRGGPRHGPPHPPTLGRAPAESWRASALTQDVSSVLLYRGHSTVESARARMGWHLPFDRTERCLTRGQCALAHRDFATAEALLREALAQDPQYSHIQMYLAHALAEQERRPEAEAALERAMALAPDNFVFPLHLGIIRLDADDAAGAREALPRAARAICRNRFAPGSCCGWRPRRWPRADRRPPSRCSSRRPSGRSTFRCPRRCGDAGGATGSRARGGSPTRAGSRTPPTRWPR